MQKVAPGSLISVDSSSSSTALKAGSGVYQLDTETRQFYASKVGVVVVDAEAAEVRVEESLASNASSSSGRNYPKTGSIIIGKVTKINSRFASVLILVVDGVALNSNFASAAASSDYEGIIQKANVRVSRTDTVEIYKCFR